MRAAAVAENGARAGCAAAELVGGSWDQCSWSPFPLSGQCGGGRRSFWRRDPHVHPAADRVQGSQAYIILSFPAPKAQWQRSAGACAPHPARSVMGASSAPRRQLVTSAAAASHQERFNEHTEAHGCSLKFETTVLPAQISRVSLAVQHHRPQNASMARVALIALIALVAAAPSCQAARAVLQAPAAAPAPQGDLGAALSSIAQVSRAGCPWEVASPSYRMPAALPSSPMRQLTRRRTIAPFTLALHTAPPTHTAPGARPLLARRAPPRPQTVTTMARDAITALNSTNTTGLLAPLLNGTAPRVNTSLPALAPANVTAPNATALAAGFNSAMAVGAPGGAASRPPSGGAAPAEPLWPAQQPPARRTAAEPRMQTKRPRMPRPTPLTFVSSHPPELLTHRRESATSSGTSPAPPTPPRPPAPRRPSRPPRSRPAASRPAARAPAPRRSWARRARPRRRRCCCLRERARAGDGCGRGPCSATKTKLP